MDDGTQATTTADEQRRHKHRRKQRRHKHSRKQGRRQRPCRASQLPDLKVLEQATGLKPYAVQISVARVLLGGKSRSHIYDAAARGELDLVKDGGKTLVTVESIERRQQALPRVSVKPYAPRIHTKRANPQPHIPPQKRRVILAADRCSSTAQTSP